MWDSFKETKTFNENFANTFKEDFSDTFKSDFGEVQSLTIPDYKAENKKQDNELDKFKDGYDKVESKAEKGNLGEMQVDKDLRDKGYERVSNDVVTNAKEIGHRGIDGVYYNENGEPQYIVVETKYGTSALNPHTADGRQMSEKWIDNRLDKAVGKENADEIRMEKLLNPENVGNYVAKVSETGSVTYNKLDSNANISEKDVKF